MITPEKLAEALNDHIAGTCECPAPNGDFYSPCLSGDPDDEGFYELLLQYLAPFFAEVWEEAKESGAIAENPYKQITPPEPQLPFARVINEEGREYYRSPAGAWYRTYDNLETPWSLIGVTRVLDHGKDLS